MTGESPIVAATYSPTPTLVSALRDLGVIDVEEDPPWERLRGGFHNDVLLVRTKAAAVVVKYFVADNGNPLFPQLPADEYRVLQQLAGSGIAPDPVGFLGDVDGRALLVYRYVAGTTWAADVVAVAMLLRRVHTSRVPNGCRNLAATPADVRAHAAHIVTSVPISTRLAKQLQIPEPDTPAPTKTLVHTDCGPGNLVDAADGLRLIDWQCPGIGDPVEDLANFTSPAIQILYGRQPLDVAAVTAFVEAYGETPAAADFERRRWPYHVRLAAYCAFRRVELAGTDPAVAALYALALEAELDLLETRP